MLRPRVQAMAQLRAQGLFSLRRSAGTLAIVACGGCRSLAARFCAGLLVLVLGSATLLAPGALAFEDQLKLPDAQLEPVEWSSVPGWTADDHLAAFTAYRTSCRALRRVTRTSEHGAIFDALRDVCRRAAGLEPRDAAAARGFFEQNFKPVRIARLGEANGFLTGYYEPIVEGSRFPNPEFHVPLYRRPPDLIAVGHKAGSGPFPNKDAVVRRRNAKNELEPYYDRGAIEAGALDGQKLEICWLRDPFDALAIQIEGSGRVILEDGTPLRVNYDSYNGYPYTAVGRVLAERKLIPREELSMQRIRAWMAAHPDEAPGIRAFNRSYVFFRITGLSNDGEPVGAQGVPLTPGRSIAVDRLHEYGMPFFIEATLPLQNEKPGSPFHRLMIAQDTGSAIVGPARADLYWGAGDDAARIAGRIRHPGHFVMLLPRELDMVVAGRHMPVPVAKPIGQAEAKQGDSKDTKSGKESGVENANEAAKKAGDADLQAAKRSRSRTVRVRWRYRIW